MVALRLLSTKPLPVRASAGYNYPITQRFTRPHCPSVADHSFAHPPTVFSSSSTIIEKTEKPEVAQRGADQGLGFGLFHKMQQSILKPFLITATD